MENKVRLTYLKIAASVICVLGSALVAFAAAKVPKTASLFVLASVLPVLIPLPSLVISSKVGQTWVGLILSAAAAVGSFYQYSHLAAAPDPFALLVIWAYPIIGSGIVLVLLVVGSVLSTHFQIRRGEV